MSGHDDILLMLHIVVGFGQLVLPPHTAAHYHKFQVAVTVLFHHVESFQQVRQVFPF